MFLPGCHSYVTVHLNDQSSVRFSVEYTWWNLCNLASKRTKRKGLVELGVWKKKLLYFEVFFLLLNIDIKVFSADAQSTKMFSQEIMHEEFCL